nr:ribonuclease H-like domain-containing protein [Tenuifilaceae bacterium]
KSFAEMLAKFSAKPGALLCAHNGKEFDFPYLSRRMLINGIKLPGLLDTAGKKPWEVNHLDTMELWKFGDYKHYTSLNLLAYTFGIPTPKDDIDGSQVADVYYNEKDLNRIVAYCEKDVLTVAQLFLKYRNEPTIDMANIERA